MPIYNHLKSSIAVDVPIEENIRYYRGNSMNGTFRKGDRLVIAPVLPSAISNGDVIVFCLTNRQGETEEIVHRIVAIMEGGFITRGDNNYSRDFDPVRPDQIIGKVVMVEDGKRGKKVVGGSGGLRKAKLRRIFLAGDHGFRRLFRQPYHLLRLSKIMPKVWRVKIDKIHLKTGHGLLIKYLYRGRTVATWNPDRTRFECSKPFDLVIFSPEEQ